MTDTIFAWAVSLIQCLFDSRSAPLSKYILTRVVAAFRGLLPHYVIYIAVVAWEKVVTGIPNINT